MRLQQRRKGHRRVDIFRRSWNVVAFHAIGLSLFLGIAVEGSLRSAQGGDIPASLEGWRKPRCSETSIKIFPPDLPNLDFSRGTAGWDLPAGYSFDAHGGRHGGRCLVYSRADGGKYTFAGISFPVSKLVPGLTYCFGCWIKTESVHGSGGAGILVEFLGPDGYVGGVTPVDQGKGVCGNSDWTWFEGRFIVPPTAERFVVRPWLNQGASGKAWFDGLKIYPVNPGFS